MSFLLSLQVFFVWVCEKLCARYWWRLQLRCLSEHILMVCYVNWHSLQHSGCFFVPVSIFLISVIYYWEKKLHLVVKLLCPWINICGATGKPDYLNPAAYLPPLQTAEQKPLGLISIRCLFFSSAFALSKMKWEKWKHQRENSTKSGVLSPSAVSLPPRRGYSSFLCGFCFWFCLDYMFSWNACPCSTASNHSVWNLSSLAEPAL